MNAETREPIPELEDDYPAQEWQPVKFATIADQLDNITKERLLELAKHVI